jgi:hypothetical protein
MLNDHRRWGAVLVAGGALALCGTAAAGVFDPRPGDEVIGKTGGLKYIKDPAPFDPGNSGYASDAIFCGNRHVTGGGASLTGSTASKFIETTLPRDFFGDADDVHDDSWDASGYGDDGKRLTAFGICKRGGKLRYRYKDVPDSPTGNRSAKVSCGGAGYHAVGGGSLIAPTESWLNSSHPYDGSDPNKRPDDGWTTKVFDPVGGIGGYVMEAICQRHGDLAYVRQRAGAVDAGDAASPTAACARKAHVLGGGLKLGGPANQARAAGSYPIDRGDDGKVPDDGWRAVGYNLAGEPKAVTSYAICEG